VTYFHQLTRLTYLTGRYYIIMILCFTSDNHVF